jgi:hypothetical protein
MQLHRPIRRPTRAERAIPSIVLAAHHTAGSSLTRRVVLLGLAFASPAAALATTPSSKRQIFPHLSTPFPLLPRSHPWPPPASGSGAEPAIAGSLPGLLPAAALLWFRLVVVVVDLFRRVQLALRGSAARCRRRESAVFYGPGFALPCC